MVEGGSVVAGRGSAVAEDGSADSLMELIGRFWFGSETTV